MHHTCNNCQHYCGNLDNLQKHVASCMVDSDNPCDENTSDTPMGGSGSPQTSVICVDGLDEFVGVGDPVHSPVPLGSKQAGPARRASSRGSKKTEKMLAYEKSLKKNQDSPDFPSQDNIQE